MADSNHAAHGLEARATWHGHLGHAAISNLRGRLGLPREIQTARLLLRRWRPEDREPFAALNADPVVMEHFPKTLTREQSDALADRIEAHFMDHSFGLWAVEVPAVTPFAGFLGLSVPTFQAHFTPCVEIGWRLAKAYWGMGYATEGARAVLNFGFEGLGLSEIVSFTVPANARSRRVMERIGMSYSPAHDFDHPLLIEGHPLRRHVLYRITRHDERDLDESVWSPESPLSRTSEGG